MEEPTIRYRVMYWLFFGGADEIEKDDLSKEEADILCKKLEASNEDSTYSGFYVQPYKIHLNEHKNRKP